MIRSSTRVLELPGGGRLRARGLRPGRPAPPPSFGLYLGSSRLRRRHEPTMPWPQRWVVWPDFRVPLDPDDAVDALLDLHRRAGAGEPVEVACGGGVGRTGTALACLAVLDGLTPADAVRWARTHHHRRAVETPGQHRWVVRFARSVAGPP